MGVRRGNPLLWGLIAFVVNFVPILGPMVALVLFLMASVVSLGVTWWALLPVGLYFVVHVVEGELVTPMLMARRFTINPVAVILALVFWYWMWGVPARSWRCRCWRSPRSSATISVRCGRSGISWRGEPRQAIPNVIAR